MERKIGMVIEARRPFLEKTRVPEMAQCHELDEARPEQDAGA